MTGLFVLCAAAFTFVALTVSMLAWMGLAWLDGLGRQLGFRARARLWLGVAAAPGLAGLLAVGAAFLPALGIGHDHCLNHGPHHPHLCPHHLAVSPGLGLSALALLAGLRLALSAGRVARHMVATLGPARTLDRVCERHGGASIFPEAPPRAFVLGCARPKVYASSGLLALPTAIVEPVLAHEWAHVRARDPLWRCLFPLLAFGHAPWVEEALRRRLCMAQELAADASAADRTEGGSLGVAEALLALSRAAPSPSLGLAMNGGDLAVRIQALLDGPRASDRRTSRVMMACAVLAPALFVLSHDHVHHLLETLLGALG